MNRAETGPGGFVLGLDDSNVDEYKMSSEQWKPDLEAKPLSLSWIRNFRTGQVLS